MVTFTCNNCGDSVKKVRVEKHCTIECKRKSGNPNLCCIDCLKDFGPNYVDHTSCYTEKERYSAKGTFVANEPKNKGAKKQMTWSEIIQTISKSDGLIQSSKDILDIIRDSENVPRKEAKFKNFCKNNFHLRRFTDKDILTVFNLIQNEMKRNLEEIKAEQLNQSKNSSDNKENNKESVVGKKRNLDNNENEGVKNKKAKTNEENKEVEDSKNKKKKKKQSVSTDNNIVMEDVSEVTKKEKNKNTVGTNGVDISLINGNVDSLSNGESKKNKRKKKRNKNKTESTESNEKIEEETNEIDDSLSNGNMDTGLSSGEHKRKKKKNKNKAGESSETNESLANNSEAKKSFADVQIVIDSDSKLNGTQEDLNLSSNSTKKSPKKKRKSEEIDRHQFKDIVLKLLKPGTEFKLKSLKKMVFAVYKTGEQEVPKEVRENFNKKLSKISNVTINEKIVKMAK